ncbi:MAG: DUF5717 family protein, partial [Clostridiales bacterium]|nr:DUF5717 family protein [Clostridiales bacterium]
TTFYLCYSAFVTKKYNRDTLIYQMNNFQGEMEDLLLIWERSRKFALDTGAFEKRILEQSMFTGSDTDGLFPVFENYYKENPQEEVIGRYLEYASEKERKGIIDLPESMHAIIGEEILAGRISDRETKIHFLYYFASRKPWKDNIRETVVKIIEEFLEEEFYLPVYHVYDQWIDFPVEYLEKTYLTYRGGRGKNVVLYYQIAGEKELTRKRYLNEVLPGMYIGSMYFYQNDHVNYRLEEDDTVVSDESRLRFETFGYEGDESRFFALNHFSTEEYSAQEMEGFLRKIFFTDRLLKLL